MGTKRLEIAISPELVPRLHNRAQVLQDTQSDAICLTLDSHWSEVTEEPRSGNS